MAFPRLAFLLKKETLYSTQLIRKRERYCYGYMTPSQFLDSIDNSSFQQKTDCTLIKRHAMLCYALLMMMMMMMKSLSDLLLMLMFMLSSRKISLEHT